MLYYIGVLLYYFFIVSIKSYEMRYSGANGQIEHVFK